MEQSRQGMRCMVHYCRNCTNMASDLLRFHNFPKNMDIREKWMGFCNNPNLYSHTNYMTKRMVICSDHFTPDRYTQHKPRSKARLTRDAIPTIYDNNCDILHNKICYGYMCSAINCSNRQNGICCDKKGELVRFFNFPMNDNICKKWIVNLRNASLDNISLADFKKSRRVVCSIHFEDIMFTDASKRQCKAAKLLPNAIPTLVDAPNPPSIVTPARRVLQRPDFSHEIQSTSRVSPVADSPLAFTDVGVQATKAEMTPPKYKHTHDISIMKRQINSLRCKLRYANMKGVKGTGVAVATHSKFSSALSLLLRSQHKHAHRKLRGSRWQGREIDVALSIY